MRSPEQSRGGVVDYHPSHPLCAGNADGDGACHYIRTPLSLLKLPPALKFRAQYHILLRTATNVLWNIVRNINICSIFAFRFHGAATLLTFLQSAIAR